MKKSELHQIIKEEIKNVINESDMKRSQYKPFDNLVDKLGGSNADKQYLRTLVHDLWKNAWRKGALEGFSK